MNLLSKHCKLIFFLAQNAPKQYKKTIAMPWKAVKAKRTGLLLFLASFFLLIFSTSTKAATTTLDFSDSTPTLISGTALSAGAVYRFNNVAPGVDALVQIATISNAQLKNLDDNNSFPERFQPVIAPGQLALINATSYVRFNFKLISSAAPANTQFGTTATVIANNVYFSAQDVDGNGAINTIREFVETLGTFASYVPNPTLLQQMATLPVAGGIGYEQISSLNVQNGIGTDDRYEFYSYIGSSVSQFTIIGGNRTDATGCTLNNVGCDRQNSWSFNASDVQKLDFGDAPQSYGDAYHPIPDVPTVRLGLLAEGDDAPIYTVGADGDDTTGIDDEDGVSSFPSLSITSTTYSLSAACTTNGATVAGWIDFNRNGTFANTERAAGTCNGTSATLNWTGLTGLVAGPTYARFRMSSTASEVANPTGQASNGEVEDYSLSIGTTLSGTVFNDANGDKLQGTEAGTNAGGLNAILVDSANRVLATTTVAANGTYTFSNVPANATYIVQITTATATVGATAPAVTLPTNWVVTGENFNGTVDATADGKQSITVATSAITNVNFGIERLPDTNNVTAASQINPGGTTQVSVPALSGTDPEDGTLGTGKSFQISTLPTNATLYYNGTAVTAGQIITSYDPTKLTIDPNDGNITVIFTYAAIDAAGKVDPTPATVTMPFTALNLSGTVFDDANGNKLQGAESGTNAGGLNAVLVDSTNKVVATTSVAANGTYSFSNVAANTTYTVRITTATATVGAAPPAVTLPTNWVTTGENLNGTADATADSILTVPVTTSSITGANFGIEQRPTAVGGTAATQVNPTGTNTVTVSPTLFTGSTDPDGTVASYKFTAFPSNTTSITINGINYTSASFPAAGVTVTAAQLSGMLLDPIDGAVTVGIPFQAIDNAGQLSSNTATASLPFSEAVVTLSGTVFDDANGDKLQSGEAGTNAGGLNAILVDNTNKVVATTAVAANGTYSFTNVAANTTYTIQITTATATIGNASPAITLPANWVITGENLNSTVDMTADGKQTITASTANVTNINFGIEQLPNTNNVTAASQNNPGGTTQVQVPDLSGTDPEDGALGTGKSFQIVTLPANATLYYNGTPVTAGQTITSYDPTKLTVDPNDGNITVTFTYVAVDAAGKVDSTPATVTMPFGTAAIPSLLLVKRITAVNGVEVTTVIDDPGSANDNAANWPLPLDSTSNISRYLQGAIDGGTVRPGDILDYTIYFLSNGSAPATNVDICDLVPTNSSFIPDSFSSSSGIALSLNGTTINLTNVPDADGGHYIAAGVPSSVNCSGANTNGAVLVNVVKSPAALPHATAPGTPVNSYGYIRFRARIN